MCRAGERGFFCKGLDDLLLISTSEGPAPSRAHSPSNGSKPRRKVYPCVAGEGF